MVSVATWETAAGAVTDVSDSAAGGETVESPALDGSTDGDPANDPTVTPLAPTGELTLTKSIGTIADSNGDGLTNVGDTVSWTFTVANTGAVTLNNVTVIDSTATVSGGPIATLAPGATDAATFTATPFVIAQVVDENGQTVGILSARALTDLLLNEHQGVGAFV